MRDNAYITKRNRTFYKVDLPKIKWRITHPPRFIYHFTRGGKRCDKLEDEYYQRISIYLYGLYGKDKGRGGVWANRDLYRIGRSYPFVIDGFGWDQDQFIEEVEGYDVWRIDTSKLNNKWYLDPNMQDLPELFDGEDYLYTENSIPAFALRLFTIKIDPVHFYLYRKEKVKFDLIPVEVIRSR